LEGARSSLPCASEEEYQRKLAKDLRHIAADEAKRRDDYADKLEKQRRAIMALLPKDSRVKRPDLRTMLQECRVEDRYYVMYRIASQLMHGGPAVCIEVFDVEVGPEGKEFFFKHFGYSAWADLLKTGSWSIVQPGATVLFRAEAPAENIKALYDAHDRVLAAASELGTDG
jgi:hypothetical protein